jgi:hypothetical protein
MYVLSALVTRLMSRRRARTSVSTFDTRRNAND